jgi:uncharacterized protein (DUF1015 family)
LRYSESVSLPEVICPPFDTISAEQQEALYARSPHNAVRIELAEPENGDRYETGASTLAVWREEGVLRRDDEAAFYVHRYTFQYGDSSYTRTALFARLRLEPWDRGVVLPHEQTFGAPKEDRLRLLRAARVNTSPVFLFYRDRAGAIDTLVSAAAGAEPVADFSAEGESHTLTRAGDTALVGALSEAFSGEVLYIADGHHRYETALGYREECRRAAQAWTGEEPENFAMVALVSASDPGLLVLPIHRLTAAGREPEEVMPILEPLFEVRPTGESVRDLTEAMRSESGAVGLATSENLFLLKPKDRGAIDALMPDGRPTAWRALDYSVANYAIMRHGLGLSDEQMTDYSTVWFSEAAEEAVAQVRQGRAKYAIILNPVPVTGVLDIADMGERMPQKSTFFYPKVPTGLLFNALDDPAG